MTVEQLAQELGLTVLCGGEPLSRQVESVYSCDLLSFVMGRAPADSAWVTVMGNMNAMAVALLADWAMFDPTGPRLHRMEIDILPDNKRSRAVARKVGATLEGVRRAYMYVNDQWRDHESYVLMAEDAPNGFTARLMTGNSPS